MRQVASMSLSVICDEHGRLFAMVTGESGQERFLNETHPLTERADVDAATTTARDTAGLCLIASLRQEGHASDEDPVAQVNRLLARIAHVRIPNEGEEQE